MQVGDPVSNFEAFNIQVSLPWTMGWVMPLLEAAQSLLA